MKNAKLHSVKIFLPALFLGLTMSTYGQKNLSKVSVSDALVKMLGFSQERVLTKRVSLQANIKVMPLTRLAGAKYSDRYYPDPSRNPFREAKIRGGSASAELRIYGKWKQVTEGVYWGPYFGGYVYHSETGHFRAEFTEAKSKVVYQAGLQQTHTFSWVGGGLQIGMQKKIGRLRLDWTILGIGLNNLRFKGRLNVTNASENFDLRQFDTGGGDAKLALEKYFPLQKTVEAQAILLQGKALVPMIKMGVAIGICY